MKTTKDAKLALKVKHLKQLTVQQTSAKIPCRVSS